MCHELSYWRLRERSAAKAEPEKQEIRKSPAPEPVKEPVAKLREVEPA